MRYALLLVAVCVAVFVLQQVFPAISENFILVSSKAAARPWTLATAIFLHADILHLGYNMIALVMFGLVLEGIIGSRKFLVLFMASGIFASFISLFFYEAALGASGAIFGVIGTLAVLRPKMPVFAMGVPMPMFVAAGVWALIDMAGTFAPSGVANIAHLAGLGLGIAIGFGMKQYRAQSSGRHKKPLNEKEIDEWESEWM